MPKSKKSKKNNKANNNEESDAPKKQEQFKHVCEEEEHQKNLSSLLTTLTKTIRTTNSIPSDDEYDFQISLLSHTDYTTHISESKKIVYDMIHSITKAVDPEEDDLVDQEEDDEYVLELSHGIMDDLLSSVDFYLNPDSTGSSNDNIFSRGIKSRTNKLEELIGNIVSMVKPQITYGINVDNDRMTPFKPRVDDESNLVKIDGYGGNKAQNDNYQVPKMHYQHPYKIQIENIKYPDFLFTPPPETTYKEDLTYEYINTKDQLSELSTTLQNEAEIAIDLEHHSYHSFQGITCLLQISLRNGKNYLIDTLALYHDMHEHFKCIFMNPNIIKLIHGCYNDVLWLQRDFSLYLVNVYDTCVASKILGCTSSNRLSSLISKYCPGVIIDKSFQLSDWRQRPLPDDMKRYAVMDTRYLYRIYDAQRRELKDIKQVLTGSNAYALKIYEKEPIFSSGGYERHIPLKRKNLMTEKQHTALKLLWNWRDEKARNRDESLHYVCPTNVLIRFGLDGCSYTWTEVMKECRSEIMSFLNDSKTEQQHSSPELQLTPKQTMEPIEEEWESKNTIQIHPSNKDYKLSLSLFSHSSIVTTTTKEIPFSTQKNILNQLQTTMQSYLYQPWKDKSEEPGMKRKLFEEENKEKETPISSLEQQYDIPTKKIKKQKKHAKNVSNTPQQSKEAVGLLPETIANDNPFFRGAAITACKSTIKEVKQKKSTPTEQKKKNTPKYTRTNPSESGNQTFVYVKKK